MKSEEARREAGVSFLHLLTYVASPSALFNLVIMQIETSFIGLAR